jgi:Glycosyl transferase family 2
MGLMEVNHDAPVGIPRVLIGILSYNERDRLKSTAFELFEQASPYDAKLVLLDESSDKTSRDIAVEVSKAVRGELLPTGQARRGRVECLNVLAHIFNAGRFDIMLHFDSDLAIDRGCVGEMITAVRSGWDLVSVLSFASRGRNLFERAGRVMVRPTEILRGEGKWEYPQIAHGGGYSSRAVNCLFPIMPSRSQEDLLVLAKAKEAGLRSMVVPSARVKYRLVNNVNDYLALSRRHFGLLENYTRLNTPKGSEITGKLFARPSMKLMLRAVFEDPAASLLLPFLLSLRYVAAHSAPPYPTETWDVIPSSKEQMAGTVDGKRVYP